MTTIADVEAVLSANPAITQVDSVMNCGRINSMLQLDIETDLGIEVEMVRGTIPSTDPDRPGQTPHMWLRIPAGQLEDASGEVIVDGALDQFTAANYDAHEDVNASLNPNGETIPSLVVATPGSREYQYYTGTTPLHT